MHDDPEEFDAELDDREDPDPEEADWNTDPSTVSCPHCGQEVSEEAEWCPNCDQYISVARSLPNKKPIWLIVGVVVLLLLTLIGWLRWG